MPLDTTILGKSASLCQHSERETWKAREGAWAPAFLLNCGLRKPPEAISHRKAASRFSDLPSPETEKIKHLKLYFSLWLLLNVMVGPGQLELEFRIIWEFRATHPSVCVCVCVCVCACVVGGWEHEPCLCFRPFCHELKSAVALSFSCCHGVNKTYNSQP